MCTLVHTVAQDVALLTVRSKWKPICQIKNWLQSTHRGGEIHIFSTTDNTSTVMPTAKQKSTHVQNINASTLSLNHHGYFARQNIRQCLKPLQWRWQEQVKANEPCMQGLFTRTTVNTTQSTRQYTVFDPVRQQATIFHATNTLLLSLSGQVNRSRQIDTSQWVSIPSTCTAHSASTMSESSTTLTASVICISTRAENNINNSPKKRRDDWSVSLHISSP